MVSEYAGRMGVTLDPQEGIESLRQMLMQELPLRSLLVYLLAQRPSEILDGKGARSLKESMRLYRSLSGHAIVAATDIGDPFCHTENEDRVAIHSGADFAAVIDGISGQWRQGDAVKIANALGEAFLSEPADALKAVSQAQGTMQSLGVHKGDGACFISGRVIMKEKGEKFLDRRCSALR